MQFSLKVPLVPSQTPLDYDSKVLLLGSCFSENIGSKFTYFKFQTTINPFGIIFNAVSLELLIKRCLDKDYFTEQDVFFHQDLWHCFEVHSDLSHPDQNKFLTVLNNKLNELNQKIKELTHVFITFGTSWVYRHRETQQIVANCHKVPQKVFEKELLSVDQNRVSIQNLMSFFYELNPKLQLVFTISPVRHIKDGFFENQVSKGHLFAALHQICSEIDTRVNYFPSYEIVQDELRDYRFFEKDMLHPNALAIDYIWEQLTSIYCTESTHSIMKEIASIQKALAHRSFNPNTASHQKFLFALQQKIKIIQNKVTHIQF
ncbi:GSCFA domain-containing protein [Flavobacterium sp.]|uniref:GSCFA domain-containing protein n=1 Tax=Flavobacterium sp. TaxID=239 RepID=UPI0025C3931E|nr:GSCFA domain-containing protein [Flavobacterium sp.]